MPRVINWYDTGTPVGPNPGDSVAVGNNTVPALITPCAPPCDEIIQGEIICSLTDAWNNNLCSNDSCYNAPVVPGDCLFFQFQFQNTRNAKNSISWVQYAQRPFPKIQFNWFHNTANPTNWTIKAKMIDACTNAEYKVGGVNYADIIMRNAGIFLSQDRSASAKTLPNNSWYRWTQNGIFCLPSTLPNNFPNQFYFSFEIKNFANTSSFVYSQIYSVDNCSGTVLLEGIYNLKDCLGYDYSVPKDNDPSFPVYGLGNPFDQVINSSFLYLGRERGYRNMHRLRGTANYVGRLIEKDIPERQCLSIKTSVKEQYDFKIKPVPPYVAEIINNNLSGSVAYISGVPNQPAIQVQPNSGAVKNNDVNNMWVVDILLNGCECLDYHQC